MPRVPIILAIGKWLRKYAVLIILLSAFSHNMVSVLVHGMEPRPQLPPTGYSVEKTNVVLQWNRGNIDAPITLQVSKSKNFEETVFEKEVGGITHSLSLDFEKGQTYYWRLLQDDHRSAVSSFQVSPYHVNL